jgi:hypothetical protein
LPRKRGHEEDEDIKDDDEMEDKKTVDDDDDDEDDDDEDVIDLDKAEEEEDDDDDVDDDDDDDEADKGKSVEQIERQKLFQAEAEDVLESLTMDDVREVLKESDLEESLAPKLKKFLVEVINEGEVVSMDEAWEEAIERLDE